MGWRGRLDQTLTGYVNEHLNIDMLCYTFAAILMECIIDLYAFFPSTLEQTHREVLNTNICAYEELQQYAKC
jgi:hypothetical protein